MVKGEIKVGDLTLTQAAIGELTEACERGKWLRLQLCVKAIECCEILGIDPDVDSVAKDIAEEIVLHGTSVAEVIERLQKRLEESQ
jgi:hypothetical protein